MTVGQMRQGSISDKIFLAVLQYPLRVIGSLVVLVMVVGWMTNEQSLFTAGLTMVWFATIIFGSIGFCNNTSIGKRLIAYSWKLTFFLFALIAFVLLVEVAVPLSMYLWHEDWCGFTCVIYRG